MGRMRLSVSVEVRATPEAVWAALTDWPAQGEWMIATRVRAVDGDGVGDGVTDGRGVGGRIEAFTGFGRVGFLDTMVVTDWRPPTRCDVLHTGRVVRGTGTFAITPTGQAPGAAGAAAATAAACPAHPVALTWIEDLDIPGGVLGRSAFALLSPLVRRFVRTSLTRLARMVESSGPDRRGIA